MYRTQWTTRTSILVILVLGIGLTCQAQDSHVTRLSAMQVLKWESVAPGVWKAAIGKKELAPLDYAGEPRRKALAQMGEAPFPFAHEATRGQVNAGHASVRLPLEESEKIYGLGLEFKGMNRRSDVYHLKVDHYGGFKGATHSPVPFYISSKGYGVFINTARRPSVYAGIGNRKDSKLPPYVDRTTGHNWSARPTSDAVEASVDGDGLEVYVFGGNTPLEAVRRYNLYCGGGVLPPRWGLGCWRRVGECFALISGSFRLWPS